MNLDPASKQQTVKMADISIKRQSNGSSGKGTSGSVKPVKMDRRSASRARSSGRSGSEANDSEKVTLYLSGQKASEYQQRKCAEEVPEDGAIKCDSEKEVNSLKRKSVAVNQATCDNGAELQEEPTYAAVLKHSDKENTQPAATASHKRMKMDPLHGESPVKVVVSKPPIPPKPDVAKAPSPPATTKSKKHVVSEAHNALTVQKLLAQNEQMRLEINELRTSLATERGAVRVLR